MVVAPEHRPRQFYSLEPASLSRPCSKTIFQILTSAILVVKPPPARQARPFDAGRGKGKRAGIRRCVDREAGGEGGQAETGTRWGESITGSGRDQEKPVRDWALGANRVNEWVPREDRMSGPGSSRTRRGCTVKSPFSLLSPPPPQLAQGGRNGTGLRGLFGAVEWKIDFNPLCSCKGARSALPDQGSRHSGGPLPRPGLESPQSCRVCRPHCLSGLGRPRSDVSPRAVLGPIGPTRTATRKQNSL